MNFDEIRRILENINRIQREAVRDEIQEETCSARRFESRLDAFNTRPIIFYGIDRQEWEFPINREDPGLIGDPELSSICRVENVVGDSVTCRVLRMIPTNNEAFPIFESTNSFFTLRLVDIASCRCLRDTFVDLCIR